MRTMTACVLLLISCAAPALAQDVGAALFKANCANCHNYSGDGKTLAGRKMVIPDLRSEQVQSLSDDELFRTIANGTGHKQYPHVFLSKGMSAGQVKTIVGYVRTLKAKR